MTASNNEKIFNQTIEKYIKEHGMSERIIYLNGDYIAESEAKLPVFDRGLLFADAVYEGFGILDGQIVDFIYHMQRLERSLGELSIPMTFQH